MTSILIVEDSSSMRQLASFTLKNAGYEIAEAIDGEDGLRQAKLKHFDAVLTDVNMPKKNGFELAADLRNLPDYQGVPILMLTTESSAAMMQKGKQFGITGWLVKPFHPAKLTDAFKKMCN